MFCKLKLNIKKGWKICANNLKNSVCKKNSDRHTLRNIFIVNHDFELNGLMAEHNSNLSFYHKWVWLQNDIMCVGKSKHKLSNYFS